MIPKPNDPRRALNKAYLKLKPERTAIDLFKEQLLRLIELSEQNQEQHEEFHKNLVSEFLKNTYYQSDYFINVHDRNDLVIHNGTSPKTPVGVIIEAKKPSNKSEMLSKENLNAKAFHELLLYYLRERITQKNVELKYLVATNINEWFIFDANLFEKDFANNKALVKNFKDFEAGRLSGNTTEFFYKDIAEPAIRELKADIEFTYFNLKTYQKSLTSSDKKEENRLIPLFKLLSPEHLLKLPFINDSNSLDKRFYIELLHIIGLGEVKQGGKKVIERRKSGERQSGSLLENTILQLDTLDKIGRLENPDHYGGNHQERLFNVALELVITWVNRILFLKLLEAQLVRYHKGDATYAFLNSQKIHNYDDLNSLFFQVLARKHQDRSEDIQKIFANIPYLNSSLFEPTELEHLTLFISQLQDEKNLDVTTSTVLKNDLGKKLSGKLEGISYLFEFLEAYDFSSEGSEEIQEENKTLINASVLGLIFEKINGYKDGSFFTPGFITMYMCRETIRRVVVQKFNEAKSWDCKNLDDLYDNIEDRNDANEIINNLKICDPAVGSGHFLVSALNEIIAIKGELKILQDRQGKRLKEYQLEVLNDELIISDDENEFYEYHPANKESQRVQEALFHEKQTIIENCLFGVDINPNSVKICRLRLWIELLKSAYYISPNNHTENNSESIPTLETLPNIDINIKCGNSLISRFDLDSDLKDVLKKSKWSIDSYRLAVDTYRNAQDKEQKREMERLIRDIKSDFRSEITRNDPKLKRLAKAKGGLIALTTQTGLFEKTAKEQKVWQKQVEKLTSDIQKLEAEIEEIKYNKVYEDAFEWRFEFPEVLDSNGNFTGFDVVIGNPPYIRQEEISPIKNYLGQHYKTFAGMADLYVYFVERGLNVCKTHGEFVYILPNKWMRAGYGKALRNWITTYDIESIIDFGDLPVFEEATTYPCMWFVQKKTPAINKFQSVHVDTLTFREGIDNYIQDRKQDINMDYLNDSGWTLVGEKVQKLINKIKHAGTPLAEYVEGKIFYGIKTGLNEAFVIDNETRDRLVSEAPKSNEIIKPFLAGRDIKRYQEPQSDKYLILFKNGETSDFFGKLDEGKAWEQLFLKYPAICNHLIQFKEKAKKRYDQGEYWWELRACDYYEEFEKPKIIYPNICKRPEFTLDVASTYTNQKCFIITEYDLTLLGILNSQLTFFLFKSILPKLRGDFYEPSYVYFKDFPIKKDNRGEIEKLVIKAINLKKENPSADTTQQEQEIDQLVYELYGLTKEEIRIVEEI